MIHDQMEQASDWRGRYRLPPRGIGYLEPGMVDPNSNAMLACRIAKSAYQQRPDVFNLQWLSKETDLARDDISSRLHRLYDRHLVMFAAAPAVHLSGQGLYYWFGKFRTGTFLGVKDLAAASCRENDAIWNGYETSGAFDFVHGACASTMDQLFWDLVLPETQQSHFDWIRVCPVARALRYEHMNLWDAPDGQYRQYQWGAHEPEALANRQHEMDETDIRLILALNRERPVSDYFDFRVLAEVSGLEALALQAGIERAIEGNRQLIPVMYLNWQKLGLTQTVFAVRLRRDVALDAKSRIADGFASISEFHTVWQFSDAHYDLGLIACSETADIASLRDRINSTPEVDVFDEAAAAHQSRFWGCRLDDSCGMWEQCAAPGSGLSEARA
jgi:hypothetical protein